MSWIRTIPKPVKLCIENPDYPIKTVFEGYDWNLSGGTKQAGILAAAFILANNVDTVIEIGIFNGFSSHILAKALASNTKHGFLLSVDINPHAIVRSQNITKGLPLTHKHFLGDSKDIDYDKELWGRKPGLAFVDGNHEYFYAKNDLLKCYEVLKPFGIIILHDYSKAGFPGVYKAGNEIRDDKGASLFFIDENRESTDYRTAIIQKKGDY